MPLGFDERRKAEWLDGLLFSRSRLLNFAAIVCLSFAFSYLLTGRQIMLANWGVIDDHEVFTYLGPDLRLPLADMWSTLIEKTEVGQWNGRFRPTFYFFKVIETAVFGGNVHLWYLTNTLCFAFFLASVWLVISRFVGMWLGGVLTASISVLALWTDVWSRLGPSEIFGAASIGAMIFAADMTLWNSRFSMRNAGAIGVTIAAVLLGGMKETFLPIAFGGPFFLFAFAAYHRRVSVALVITLMVVLSGYLACIAFVVAGQMKAQGGVDFYGKPAGLGPTIKYSVVGILDGLLRTWWIWVLPVLFLRFVKVLPSKSGLDLIRGSAAAFYAYVFLLFMYATQCGIYRMSFPHNSRYDFPAMLLVPFCWCIFACEISSKLRQEFSERAINYAQLTVAAFLTFALANLYIGAPPALALAVKRNIEVTKAFYPEIERIARSAKESPGDAIFLEWRGPHAYEPVFSVTAYLRALGVKNAIAVRVHQDGKSEFPPYFQKLEEHMLALQASGGAAFTPLSEIPNGVRCLSVGLYGPPVAGCMPFQIGDEQHAGKR